MVELIVSIVVIGIAFMSIPLIMTETTRSIETSIQQESVMAGLTQMVNIMSYKWDEQEANESINGGYGKVLDTFSIASLQCQNYSGSRRRIGHFRGEDRRRCYNVLRPATAVANLGSDGGDMDDIDDIDGSDKNMLAGMDNNSSDYKKSYTTNIDVLYVNDAIAATGFAVTEINGSIYVTPAAVPTNIKMIETKVVSENAENVVLRAFAANIGEIKYYSKSVR